MSKGLSAGRLLARSVCRYLRWSFDFQSLEEFTPVVGMRVDIMAIGPSGEIWIIECKSSRADYLSDSKWQGYLGYCDQFFWAVDSEFPHELLPRETGIILADRHDAEIIHYGEIKTLAAARRRKQLLKFARTAARRHDILTEAVMSQDQYLVKTQR